MPNEVQLELHQRLIVSLGNTFRYIFFFGGLLRLSHPGRRPRVWGTTDASEEVFRLSLARQPLVFLASDAVDCSDDSLAAGLLTLF